MASPAAALSTSTAAAGGDPQWLVTVDPLTVALGFPHVLVQRAVSDRVAVLYRGRLCEIGPVDAVYSSPCHPYTRLLMGAVLTPDPDMVPAILSETDDPADGLYAQLWAGRSGTVSPDNPEPHDLGNGHTVYLGLDPETVAAMKVGRHV